MTTVCRTCLESVEKNYVFLSQNIENDDGDNENHVISYMKMLSMCVPELSLDGTIDSVICSLCVQSLSTCYKYKMKCLEVEDILKSYLEQKHIDENSNNIVLKDVQLYKQKLMEPFDIVTIKQEIADDEDSNSTNMDECNQEQINNSSFSIKDEEKDEELESGSQKFVASPTCIKTENEQTDSTNAPFPMVPTTRKRVRKVHNNDKPSDCPFCQKYCINIKTLKTHVGHFHPDEKLFWCDMCDRKYTHRGGLTEHKMRHMGILPHKCDICDRNFFSKTHLTRHRMQHTGERPFKCQYCDKGFCAYEDMRIHTRTHTGYKPFSCDECGKTFIRRANLTNHLRTHVGDKPFGCGYCEKRYYYKGKLRDHIRLVHDQRPPHVCEQCGKGYASRSNLQVHMRTHTGIRNHECEVCHKRFYEAVHLKLHMRGHTGEKPYHCKLCGKSFTQPNALKYHNRLHTGERPFQCHLCDKAFSNKGRLTKHIRVHTGEKPYKCDVCLKDFADSTYLKYHRKRFHASEEQENKNKKTDELVVENSKSLGAEIIASNNVEVKIEKIH